MTKKTRLVVPFINDDQLVKIAHELLESTGEGDEPPVDIERMCDTLGIKIYTVPRLKSDLGIDAYIYSDFTTIVIDAYCFENHERRSRFSIAHEVSHLIAHKQAYQSLGIDSLTGYLTAQNDIPTDSIKRIEWQAYTLAGLILVPPRFLQKIVEEFCPTKNFETLTINDAQQIMVACVERFNVSSEVILRRFKHDYPELLAKAMIQED